MKKIIILGIIFINYSCMKMEDAQPALNINYPAAYVVNGESGTLSVINLTNNTVDNTINLTDNMNTGMNHSSNSMLLSYPHHIYLNPAKNQIAVAAPGMDLSAGHGATHAGMKAKVAILDAVKGQNVKLIDVPLMNHNAVYSKDGSEIWTSQMDTKGTVLVYDANTFVLKTTIYVGKEPAEVTFSVDGLLAFVANGDENSVSVIDPISKKVINTILVGANPVGAWPGADNRMYVDNEDGKSVSIIDIKTQKVIETIDLGFMPGYVAYQAEMKEMWVTDPVAGKVHWWTKNALGKMIKSGDFVSGKGAHAIAFKEMTAYISNQEAASVSVIDVMKHTVSKTVKVGNKPNGIVLKY
jgi:YVTN family beta-propeller protein